MSLPLQRDILLWRASVCEGSQMDQDDGRPLRVDPEATSSNPNLPGFLARPEGAPVYHGFPILEDVEVDGFRLGMITDWEAEPADGGDAFVVAPDDSRAGLVWEIGPAAKVEQVLEPKANRWGVWQLTFLHPMTSRENARLNLAAVLPGLRSEWQAWKAQRG
jgi:hypothetical protein